MPRGKTHNWCNKKKKKNGEQKKKMKKGAKSSNVKRFWNYVEVSSDEDEKPSFLQDRVKVEDGSSRVISGTKRAEEYMYDGDELTKASASLPGKMKPIYSWPCDVIDDNKGTGRERRLLVRFIGYTGEDPNPQWMHESDVGAAAKRIYLQKKRKKMKESGVNLDSCFDKESLAQCSSEFLLNLIYHFKRAIEKKNAIQRNAEVGIAY